MKSKARDTLIILLAVATIYGSGHGFGYIVGSRSLRSGETDGIMATEPDQWADKTLSSLRSALDLTPEQVDAIRDDVGETAAAIGDTRERALLEYHMLLLHLHDRIAPKVDETRQGRLRASQEKLQLEIDRRFRSIVPSGTD